MRRVREKPMIEEMNDRSPRSAGSTIEPDTVVMSDLHALDDRVLAGRYELGGVLGRGAKGVVYRGRDRVLRRDVAIKILYRDIAGEGEASERFRQEARLGRVSTTPTQSPSSTRVCTRDNPSS